MGARMVLWDKSSPPVGQSHAMFQTLGCGKGPTPSLPRWGPGHPFCTEPQAIGHGLLRGTDHLVNGSHDRRERKLAVNPKRAFRPGLRMRRAPEAQAASPPGTGGFSIPGSQLLCVRCA